MYNMINLVERFSKEIPNNIPSCIYENRYVNLTIDFLKPYAFFVFYQFVYIFTQCQIYYDNIYKSHTHKFYFPEWRVL